MHHFAFVHRTVSGGLGVGPARRSGTTRPAARLPAIRAGQHCREDLRKTGIIPIVVIVGDANSFVNRRVDPKVRFPVLIDDGSIRSAENIARFNGRLLPRTLCGSPRPTRRGWDANAEAIAAALAASSGEGPNSGIAPAPRGCTQSHQPRGSLLPADVVRPAAPGVGGTRPAAAVDHRRAGSAQSP